MPEAGERYGYGSISVLTSFTTAMSTTEDLPYKEKRYLLCEDGHTLEIQREGI